MDPFAGDWGIDPVLEPEVNLDLEGLEDLGLFGIKLPKIKIGLPKITIRNKWVKRALIGAAGIISGGTLPYLTRQGAIPGIKLSKEDKKLVNEFYRNAAIATGAAAAVAAAPAVLPAVGSAV
ncbi:MAG: hypothetical protein L3J76_03335, partial [Candidatus Hydrothermae bacterium]|nr:hypothetical protein [Candidatus Hydrothermae bacterium]